MGQTSSTQRGDTRQESAPRSSIPLPPHDNGEETLVNTEIMSQQPVDFNSSPPTGEDANGRGIIDALMGPSSSQSSNSMVNDVEMLTSANDHERQNRSTGETRRQDNRAPVSRMMARRQSTMSRLGSRILPNSVIRGLLSSEEETPAEGHAHRNGRLSRTLPRSDAPHSNRFSPFHSLGSRGISRRRSIRGPYPMPRGDAALIPDSPPNPNNVDSAIEASSESSRGWRRSARLSRVRDSLTTPISNIFGPPAAPSTGQAARTPPRRPSRSEFPDGTDQLLPPLAPMDTGMDFDQPHELDSVEPAMRNSRPLSPGSSTRTSQGPGPGPVRHFPGILRARSSRLLRRDEQTPLSRVLHLAATAIAAQLSGGSIPTLPNIQSLGNDGLDASLDNLIESLQRATSTQTSPSPTGEVQNQPSDGSLAPVNFLRVFRFANSDSQPGSAPSGQSTADPDEQSNRADRMDIDDTGEDGTEGRTVTLVVVGVRSVPSNGPLGNQQHGGMGLDALLGLPLIPPRNMLRDQATGSNLLRPADGGSRFSPPRSVVGGSSSFPANYDSQRHQRLPSSASRASVDPSAAPNVSTTLPPVPSESPPGPNPPPSTPAELSAVSSGITTPNRRPSSASAMYPNMLPQLHEELPQQPEAEPVEPESFTTGARQRRRSDSEYARHRHLGSGAARRNGVVEPDHPTPTTGRTWVIYVVGTNLSENHPAFATPSLFTDVRYGILSLRGLLY